MELKQFKTLLQRGRGDLYLQIAQMGLYDGVCHLARQTSFPEPPANGYIRPYLDQLWAHLITTGQGLR